MKSHVAILLRLRFKLLVASFAGRSGRRAAAAVGLFALAVWAFSFGATSYRMVDAAGGSDPAAAIGARPAVVRAVFLVTFLLQVMTGVAFLAVSDFFDTSRLLHLPVRARSVFVAMLASSVFSPGTLVFGAPAAGALAALPGGAAHWALRVGIVLALVTFGQACALFLGYLLLLGLSRRRLRDLATVLGSVIGLGSYALIRLVGPGAGPRPWTASGPILDALDFVPTSWFADVVSWGDAVRFVDPRSVVPPLLALAASVVLGAASFSRFFERAGEGAQADRTTRAAPARGRLLPPAVGAIARQTLAVVWREPQLRALLFQQMLLLLLPLVSMRGEGAAAAAAWSIPFFIVVSHAWMALSLFGIDGPGLRTVLQSPATRRSVILGRVLGVGRIFVLIDVAACGALAAVTTLVPGLGGSPARFAGIATACLVADAVLIGAGAFLSVFAPTPIVRRSRSVMTRGEGCSTTIGRTIIRLPVIGAAAAIGLVTVLPALAPIDAAWYLVTVPAGIMAGVRLCAAGIAAGARRLESREEEILAVLSQAGE